MFDKIWNLLFKKKTEKEFRQFLYRESVSLVALVAGMGWIYVNAQPWYPKHLVLVLAGLGMLYLFTYVRALADNNYFKQLYINAYDERNKEIIKLSAVASYTLVLGVILFQFGVAFGAELVTQEPKLISLGGFCGTLLGTGIIGFFGTNLLLQKFY